MILDGVSVTERERKRERETPCSTMYQQHPIIYIDRASSTMKYLQVKLASLHPNIHTCLNGKTDHPPPLIGSEGIPSFPSKTMTNSKAKHETGIEGRQNACFYPHLRKRDSPYQDTRHSPSIFSHLGLSYTLLLLLAGLGHNSGESFQLSLRPFVGQG